LFNVCYPSLEETGWSEIALELPNLDDLAVIPLVALCVSRLEISAPTPFSLVGAWEPQTAKSVECLAEIATVSPSKELACLTYEPAHLLALLPQPVQQRY
jgi:hypothetical protein